MGRRRTAAITAVLVCLAGTAGCRQATPYVTLVSGSSVVKATATESCKATGASVTHCRKYSPGVPRLTVTPGDVLGIDVARNLLGQGWYAVFNGQRTPIQKQHYFKLRLGGGDFGDNNRIDLQVYAVAKSGGQVRNTAVWAFTLVPG